MTKKLRVRVDQTLTQEHTPQLLVNETTSSSTKRKDWEGETKERRERERERGKVIQKGEKNMSYLISNVRCAIINVFLLTIHFWSKRGMGLEKTVPLLLKKWPLQHISNRLIDKSRKRREKGSKRLLMKFYPTFPHSFFWGEEKLNKPRERRGLQ